MDYEAITGGLLRRLSVFSGLRQKITDPQSPSPTVQVSSVYPSFDHWRREPPTDIEHPVAIKRDMLRRATLDTLWFCQQNVKYNSIEDIDAAEDKAAETNGKAPITKSKSCSEFSLLTSSLTGSGSNKDSRMNSAFKSHEISTNDCFVSAFGKKGKQVGEYQDAKDITCLSNGSLLITDLVNSRLQICSDTSNAVTIFSPEEIHQPWATTVTANDCTAVTLCKERCVKIFSNDGDVITKFGYEYLARPTGLTTDKVGNFIVCDSVSDNVCMFDSRGKFLRFLGNSYVKEECFSKPCYVCTSVTGDIIVSDGGHHKIKVFDAGGNFVKSFGSFGRDDKQFKCPYGVTTNKYGDIFVADHYNSRISMFSRDGVFMRHIVTSDHGLVHPQGLTISPDLHMYVTHGHLKASEILVFKLTNSLNYEYSNIISYV